MSRSSLLLTIAAAVFAAACTTVEYRLDGGPSGDAGAAGRIEVLSEPSLALAFGEEDEISVRYTEAGVPVPGVEIQFALEGRAHDSTLGDLSLVTDENGRARTTLLAGSTSAVFRVRANAERAGAQYVNVSIGNMGFGALRVGAVYEGGRTGALRRVISVYADIECAPDAELPELADRSSTLTDDEEAEALFRALPAGLRYAVVGRVVGSEGTTLASDCVDGVEIVRDSEVSVALEFEDRSLVLEGIYEVELSLAPTPETIALADAAGAAGEARIETAGSSAALYLDALDAELRSRGEYATADVLADERLGGAPDESLARRLEEAGVGPLQALWLRVERVRERLSAIELSGPVSVRKEGAGLVAGWDDLTISAGAVGDPDRPPLVFSPGELELAPELTLSRPSDEDVLEVDSIRLMLALGRLMESVMLAEAAAFGLDDPAALLTEGAGCEIFGGWIAESPALAPSCDDECAHYACVAALSEMLEAARTALGALDEIRNTITIEGVASLEDTDGDLEVEVFTGTDLSGTWSGLEVADPIGVELRGIRAPFTE
jgi:hypothetical protein